MSINSITPQTEAAVRNKINSDLRESLTDDLTIKGSHLNSSHGKAAHDVRDIIDTNKIERLRNPELYIKDYYDSLM